MSMTNNLRSIAHKYPYEIALSLHGKHVTYHQLITKIDEAKNKCLHANIKPHDKVAIMLPNIFESVVLFYALNELSVTIVMLHPLSSSTMIKKRCDLVGVTKIVVLDALLHRYNTLNQQDLIVVSMSHSCSGLEKAYLTLRYCFLNRKIKFDRLPSTLISIENIQPIQDAVILFSSGTTGEQKAISLSNDALNALVVQLENVIDPIVGEDAMYCVLPFFHGFGLGITMHTVLSLGGRCVLVPRLKKKTLVKELLKEKPSYIAGVPYLYRILLKDHAFNTSDLSFIKEAFVGGELVAPQLIEACNDLLKKQNSKGSLRIGYGMSEATTAVSISNQFDTTPNCVGYPLHGNSFLIVKEDGSIANPHELGEICVAGPVLMNGYYNNVELTKQVLKKHEGKLYYHSSDIGYMDEQGQLYFSHRKDELMKVRGYFVNPLEVEGELYRIEGCMEAKVFVNGKETLCAMLVFDKQTNKETMQEKTTKALEHLDRWSIPKQYYVVKEIPKNEMRKYDIKRINQTLDQQEIEFLQEWSL